MKVKVTNSMLNFLLGGRFKSDGTIYAPQLFAIQMLSPRHF